MGRGLRGFLLCAVFVVSCHHVFQYAPSDGDSVDAPVDSAPDLVDQVVDPEWIIPQVQFRCEEKEKEQLDRFAEAGTDTVSLGEPAITPTGQTLYATSGTRAYLAQRDGESFGPWMEDTDFPDVADPSFFNFGADPEEGHFLIGATRNPLTSEPPPRTLKLYRQGIDSWEKALEVSIINLTGDVDGPKVYNINGITRMLLNTKIGDALPDIYLATLVVADSLMSWSADPIGSVAASGINEDDPTIDPFGDVLVFAIKKDDNSQLHYVLRQPDESYSERRRLYNLDGQEPELWRLSKTSTQFDLFYSAERAGVDVIFRAACTL